MTVFVDYKDGQVFDLEGGTGDHYFWINGWVDELWLLECMELKRVPVEHEDFAKLLAGLDRDELINLHSFLTSEDESLRFSSVSCQWHYDRGSSEFQEYGDPDHLIVKNLKSGLEFEFDFSDPYERQAIEHLIQYVVNLLDAGCGL